MKRILIVGTGVAGLSVARTISQYIDVVMFCKGSVDDGATPLAQGGIAIPIGKNDSIETHVNDTLRAGHLTNNIKAVTTIISQARNCLTDLLSLGFRPDRNPDGSIHLGLEGGHSQPRIIHSADNSGKHLHDVLLKDVRSRHAVEIVPFTIVESIIENEQGVAGVITRNTFTDEVKYYTGDAVVIATGGIGALFPHTTNPASATGDGLELAMAVGAHVTNIDKIQWHPTALSVEHTPAANSTGTTSCVRMPLITEALRGAGARLVDINGEDVVPLSLHKQGCLAPRDVVTQACWDAMKRTNNACVYLDATVIDEADLRSKFPGVMQTCKEYGINLSKERIPVVPAVHYLCGGITTDLHGATNIQGLYAVGECADTGLNGENRLASNSLLEGLVMGRLCGTYLNNVLRNREGKYIVN